VSITLDANILVYASDVESPVHEQAAELVDTWAGGRELLYLFWPVLTAYVRVSTHPAVFARPLRLDRALANLESLIERPHVRTPGEDDRFWPVLRSTLVNGAGHGNLVTDAHIVALMHQYNVRTIFTRDRDFRRFDGITARDPFAQA
jgi:toxin-antitoxin system PIN domain toxin